MAELMFCAPSDTRSIWVIEMNPKYDTKKILDSELVKFAESYTNKRISVVVEIFVEPPQVELTKTGIDADTVRPLKTLPIDVNTERQRMDKMEIELKKLIVGEVVRLETAQAFVADLTPDELCAVSLLPDTGYLRPNRKHQV
jgi:hypothetical protein